MSPAQRPVAALHGGEVGYITGAIKSIAEARVGDTITLAQHAADASVTPLPGYREPVPMVYCGLYPTEGDDYPKLRDSIEKLKTNDAALLYEPDVSSAMGFGFRCGFLGLLHMEIVQERLEREYDLDLITTAPTVRYLVVPKEGETFEIETPEETVTLTTREVGLLRALVEREGETVTRGELLEEVWGLRPDTKTRVIDSFIVRLRKYLERDPSAPEHIVSVRGRGYRFER